MRALLIPLLLLTGPALALDDGERAAARQVITGQIEAFGRDDATAAYGFAAPAIQRLFPDREGFMAMVRQGYAPVYRPRRFEFGAVEEPGAGTLSQTVTLQDSAGADWVALYTLERQADGSWKITGCRLLRAPGESA